MKNDDHFRITKERGTTYVRLPIVAFIGAILLIALLTLLLWSEKRHPEVQLQVKNPGELAVLLPSIAGLTHSTLEPGNSMQVLQNGNAFWPPLMRDIAAAKESIHLETYIWYDGQLTRQLIPLLARKAREGVEVRVLEKRLDYILTDPGWIVRSARVLDDGPSDHRPVLAELTHP